MGVVTVDRIFGEFVIDTSVLTGIELGEALGGVIPVFPGVESVDNGAVGASDMVVSVLVMVRLNKLVVSSGVDVPWDAVCAGGEPLVKGGKVDMVTSVRVV